ncbi:nuclear autoantigenic sperm protein [Fopius arisanus]|uniref:HIBN_0 protein n=1 Tax=Fopius arisanus TaxID=64838 RepID=A0A0C9RKU6_9HYME|nr:PREDICTED: nuclear autoantigenic sperm protein [Fopius arisanus]XP_011298549.1 PREDICTED: nuclear autoantigenic sperm protein [Fopius arisanus]
MADVAEQAPFTDPAAAISQGKRHLLVRDYTAAVTAFAEGLELLSQKHGDCGDELGEPYLLYGRALLGLAREETGVLGGGVPGGDEEDEEDDEDDEVDDEKLSGVDEKDEKEEDGQNKEVTVATERASASKEGENKSENDSEISKTDDNKIEGEKVEKPENAGESLPSSSNGSRMENGEGIEKNGNTIQNGEGEGEDVNKEEEDEDPGRGIDLQVAWEVLELAKMVFFKRGPSGYKQLAEAHRLLGEVAMESGNQQVAVSDLEKALKILENVEPREARAMAELHYQLGLAHSLGNDFDASIEQFNEATNLLEARIKELESAEESPKSDDPFYTVEGEISELKELLPEIQDKIADMKDFKQEACRLVIEGIKSKVAGGCTNGVGTSSDGPSASGTSESPKIAKPASDISHLVRKKRKNEEPEPEAASPCKKQTP